METPFRCDILIRYNLIKKIIEINNEDIEGRTVVKYDLPTWLPFFGSIEGDLFHNKSIWCC